MEIDPHNKTLTYSLGNIASVESAVKEIENEVLANESISGTIARNICSELGFIREALSLKPGIRRHEKWLPKEAKDG